jgi:hypothetical protein
MQKDLMDKFPQGYWICNEKKFVNKYQAMVYSTGNKKPIFYNYFNDIWKNFDRSLLGKYSLNELYKQRAKQLREKYDYLILYFSGGADSYNVLRSFIDNDIKLDEVCVKWCSQSYTSNTKIYQPNTFDKTSYNYLSEWDFAIKPVLEELSQKHPNIKIQIVDWFKDKDQFTIERAFSKVNHWHDCEINSLAVWSPSEDENLNKGKRVGSIYGIDKPEIFYGDKTAYLFFKDITMAMGTPNDNNIFGTEYFYYAPDFPLLTFEMAHTVIRASAKDEILRKTRITKKFVESLKVSFSLDRFQIYQKEVRHVLYSNWTDRFQCFKPEKFDRSDKHNWIYKHPEIKTYKNLYQDFFNSYIEKLDKENIVQNEAGEKFYKFLRTELFPVCEYEL